MSDKNVFERVCENSTAITRDAMQGLHDILDSSFRYLKPVVNNLFFTLGMSETGSKGNGGSKKDTREVSAVSKSSKPPGLPFNRNLIRLAGLSGGLAVGLGAYGAHVIMINSDIPEDRKNSYRTGNMYHFVGTFGLVAASLSTYPKMSGMLMAVGTIVFCGSCYVHGLTGDPTVKKVAPFGGTTLIIAWLSLLF